MSTPVVLITGALAGIGRAAAITFAKAGNRVLVSGRRYDPPEHLWLAVNFSPSAPGQTAGLAFLERKLRRTDRDPGVSADAAARQLEAIGNYTAGGESVQNHLKDIRVPTLIVQGSNNVIIPTINSYVLQQKLPNAQLILYPDANHGSFYQYPDLFVKQATLFLDA